jgi:lipoprotein-anchoring transpeptidase ErfK/SrfK
MRGAHGVFRTVAVIALGVLGVLSGCGPSARNAVKPVTLTETSSTTASTPHATATASATATTPAAPGPASPSSTAAPSPSASKTVKPKPSTSPTCVQTANQKVVETALAAIGTYGAIVVDGHQTTSDCDTIKRFQRRMGISPANGSANGTTTDVAKRIAATDTGACNAGMATIACVDLTHQTFYVMQGGKAVVGPTVTRTGKKGYATPAGTFTIFEKSKLRWSTPFHVWMPYWQQFYNGDGLHETTTYIHDMAIGSHGCVNLLHGDAVAAYNLLTYGSKVRLYGRRPGT